MPMSARVILMSVMPMFVWFLLFALAHASTNLEAKVSAQGTKSTAPKYGPVNVEKVNGNLVVMQGQGLYNEAPHPVSTISNAAPFQTRRRGGMPLQAGQPQLFAGKQPITKPMSGIRPKPLGVASLAKVKAAKRTAPKNSFKAVKAAARGVTAAKPRLPTTSAPSPRFCQFVSGAKHSFLEVDGDDTCAKDACSSVSGKLQDACHLIVIEKKFFNKALTIKSLDLKDGKPKINVHANISWLNVDVDIAISAQDAIFKPRKPVKITLFGLIKNLGAIWGDPAYVHDLYSLDNFAATESVWDMLKSPALLIEEIAINTNRSNLAVRFKAAFTVGEARLDFTSLFFWQSKAFVLYFEVPADTMKAALTKFLSTIGASKITPLFVPDGIKFWFASSKVTLEDVPAMKFGDFKKSIDQGFGVKGKVKLDGAHVASNYKGLAREILGRIQGAVSLEVKASASQLSVSLELPDFILKKSDHHTLSLLGPQFELSTELPVPKIEFKVTCGLGWVNKATGTDTKFKAQFKLDSSGTGTLTLEQQGLVVRPLMIPNTQLLGLKGSLSASVTSVTHPPYIAGGVLAGTLRIGEDVENSTIKAIQGSLGFGVDIESPKKNWLYASVNSFYIRDVLYHFIFRDVAKLNRYIPAKLQNSGMENVAVSYAVSEQKIEWTDPKSKELKSADIFPGLMLKGTISLLGWKGRAEVSINTKEGEVAVKAECSPIKIPIKQPRVTLARSEGDKKEGPLVNIVVGSKGVSGEVNGYLDVVGMFGVGLRLKVESKGFSYKGKTTLWNSYSAEVSLSADWGSFQSLGFKLNLQFELGKESKVAQSMAANVDHTADVLQLANCIMPLRDYEQEPKRLDLRVELEESAMDSDDDLLQALLNQAQDTASSSGRSVFSMFQEKLAEFYKQRRARVKSAKKNACGALKKVHDLFNNFGLKVSFDLALDTNKWAIQASYELLNKNPGKNAGTIVSGNLEIALDLKDSYNVMKTLIEHAWSKLRLWIMGLDVDVADNVQPRIF
eukprot:TRINITY_DN4653_c0_g7_i1.p1 TRINITY_DN4653_c0_g7~~TRINITY_DN4653_c0_g7_i1.p1  ORF type:complete len:1013 (-),score=281.72 TRINITY_DN4653_c0_g7_i1:104-3142(-)